MNVHTLLASIGTGHFGGARRDYRCASCDAALPDRSAWLVGGLCAQCLNDRSAAQAAERIQARRSTIPEDFRVMRFRTPELKMRVPNALARAAAEKMAVARTLTIHGPSSTGKTTLVAALMNKVLDEGGRRASTARFLTAEALAEARWQHRLGDGEAPLVAAALGSSYLVLDDLGKEPARKREAVVETLRHRCSNGLATVVTTELDEEEVARVYATDASSGEHLARRLFAAPAMAIDMRVHH